jgi:hypothetical protein
LDVPPKTHCPECRVEVRLDHLARHRAKHDRHHAALQRQMTRWQGDRESRGVDPLLRPPGRDSKDHPAARAKTLSKSGVNVTLVPSKAKGNKQGGKEVKQDAFDSPRETTRCSECGVQVRKSRLGHHLIRHARGKISRKRKFESESVWTVSGGLPDSNRRRR